MKMYDKRDMIIQALVKLVLLLAQAALWGTVKPGTIQEADITEARNELRDLAEDFRPREH
jgi:hypothetical protein